MEKVWIVIEEEFNGCRSDNWISRIYGVYSTEQKAKENCPKDCPGYKYHYECWSIDND